jgi:hypothetical protein
MAIEKVFPPTRVEPFFETIPGYDVSNFKITVRWQNYLDRVGENTNETEIAIDASIAGLEAEIQQTQSFTAELAKRDNALDSLIEASSLNAAKISELTKIMAQLEVFDTSKLEAKIAELAKKVQEINELVE